MQYLHGQIGETDKLIARICGELEQCRRLVAIPGIGPITATATVAAIGNGAAFKKGRGFSAWLGVVPGEHSTGGKQKLTGTSRRGNKYLRKLFVQGAHTVLLQKTKQSSGLSTWLVNLASRKRTQVATVALANKMARCLASSDLPVVLPQEEMLPENFVCFGPKFDVDRDEIVSSVSTFLQDTYRGW
jgi:transposase